MERDAGIGAGRQASIRQHLKAADYYLDGWDEMELCLSLLMQRSKRTTRMVKHYHKRRDRVRKWFFEHMGKARE